MDSVVWNEATCWTTSVGVGSLLVGILRVLGCFLDDSQSSS